MELTLSGCSITHIPKDGKKKKHELKIVHQGADALVLAVQSKEQAEEWLKVTQRTRPLRPFRPGEMVGPFSHWIISTLFLQTDSCLGQSLRGHIKMNSYF